MTDSQPALVAQSQRRLIGGPGSSILGQVNYDSEYGFDPPCEKTPPEAAAMNRTKNVQHLSNSYAHKFASSVPGTIIDSLDQIISTELALIPFSKNK